VLFLCKQLGGSLGGGKTKQLANLIDREKRVLETGNPIGQGKGKGKSKEELWGSAKEVKFEHSD